MTLVDLANKSEIEMVTEKRSEALRVFKDATDLVSHNTGHIRLITTALASQLLLKAGCDEVAAYFAGLNRAVPRPAVRLEAAGDNAAPPPAPLPRAASPQARPASTGDRFLDKPAARPSPALAPAAASARPATTGDRLLAKLAARSSPALAPAASRPASVRRVTAGDRFLADLARTNAQTGARARRERQGWDSPADRSSVERERASPPVRDRKVEAQLAARLRRQVEAQMKAVDAAVRHRYTEEPMPPTVQAYHLTDEEKVADYGLRLAPEKGFVAEVDNYVRHCMLDVNTNRGQPYLAPVQTTSIHGTRQVINGFMGFCYEQRGVQLVHLRLSLFADPQHIVHFLGFIRGRDVGKAQLAKQVGSVRARLRANRFCSGPTGSVVGTPTGSVAVRPDLLQSDRICGRLIRPGPGLSVPFPPSRPHPVHAQVTVAKKINDYLKAGPDPDGSIREHADRMEAWLAKLLTQLRASPSIPVPVTMVLPEHHRVSIWARTMASRALARVDADMEEHGTLTYKTAKEVGTTGAAG